MATESIFNNIFIDNPIAAERFIATLEKATRTPSITPTIEVEDIDKNNLDKYWEMIKR